jgi:hypothetical protein
MKCSKEGRQARVTKGKKPQAFFNCCWKGESKNRCEPKPPTKKYDDPIEIGGPRMKKINPNPPRKKAIRPMATMEMTSMPPREWEERYGNKLYLFQNR